ncbi:MAG: FHA domain-containing protein, partial [Planctomycetota bacterium]
MIHVEITDIPAGTRRSSYYNKAQVTIGKADDNDVVIVRPNVSRHHAKLVLKNGGMVVEDLNSTNGTLLNGERVIGSQPFGPDDEVRVGDFSFHAKPKAQEKIDDTA